MKKTLRDFSKITILPVFTLLFYVSFYCFTLFEGGNKSIVELIFLIMSVLSLAAAFLVFIKNSKQNGTFSYVSLVILPVLFLILFSIRKLQLWNDSTNGETIERIKIILDVLYYILAGTGFLFSILFFASEKSHIRNRYSVEPMLNSVLIKISILTFFLVIVNLLANYRPMVIDLTAPGRYSLSQSGKTIIGNIKSKVEVVAFYPYFHDFQREVELMLKSIQSANPLISYQIADAARDREIADEFTTDRNGWIVFRTERSNYVDPRNRYNERKVSIAASDDLRRMERDFTTALLAITSEQKKVYFTRANGEITVNGPFNESTVSRFDDSLRQANYSISETNPKMGYPPEVPADADVLVMLNPTRNFPVELEKSILNYLKNGGKVFLTLEPDAKIDLKWLESEFGVQYNHVKLQSELFLKPDKSQIVATSFAPHPVTSSLINLPETDRFLMFAGSGSFSASSNKKSDAIPVKVDFPVLTDPRTWDVTKNENSIRNLVTTIEIKTIQENRKGKLIIFGDSDFIRNSAKDYGRNTEIALNAMNWLSDDDRVSALIPPVFNETRVNMQGYRDNLVFYFLIYLWPALIFTLGVVYRKLRR